MKCKKILVSAIGCTLLLTACSKPAEETTAEPSTETTAQETETENQTVEIDAKLLKELEDRAAAAHARCALERYLYVDICHALKEIADGVSNDPQSDIDYVTGHIDEAEAKLAEKEAQFIASAAEGTDFEEGTYMAEHGFKLYTQEQACIPDAAYVFMSDTADLSENPMPDYLKDICYVDPDVIDKQPYIIDNTGIHNDNYGAYYDVNGSDEMQKRTIRITISYLFEDHHEEYQYDGYSNIWYAFGIYDKYTGQLLFNDYYKTTTASVTYKGKTADVTMGYVEDTKQWGLRKLSFEYTIEAPENYDGAVFTVLPVTKAADPSYDLADYEPYQLRFFDIMSQK